MRDKKTTLYQKLVYVAYGYYLLLGGAWLLITLLSAGHFNLTAFIIVLVFGLQAYFRHLLANLIIGVVALFLSFFMLMDVLNTFDLLSKNAEFNTVARILLAMAVCSIGMAGILIFSYSKLMVSEEELD